MESRIEQEAMEQVFNGFTTRNWFDYITIDDILNLAEYIWLNQ
jgi:hypothetical protein